MAGPSELRKRARELRAQAAAILAHRDLNRAVATAAEALRDEADRIEVLAQECERLEMEVAKVLGDSAQTLQQTHGKMNSPAHAKVAKAPDADYDRVKEMRKVGRGRRIHRTHELYAWLDATGSNLTEFADKMDVSRALVGYWVNGARRIPKTTAAEIELLSKGAVPVGCWFKLK